MKLVIDYPLKRMLPVEEAAKYCDIPLSKFPRACPVKPTMLAEGLKPKWDIRDFDDWIDSRKGVSVAVNPDSVVDAL